MSTELQNEVKGLLKMVMGFNITYQPKYQIVIDTMKTQRQQPEYPKYYAAYENMFSMFGFKTYRMKYEETIATLNDPELIRIRDRLKQTLEKIGYVDIDSSWRNSIWNNSSPINNANLKAEDVGKYLEREIERLSILQDRSLLEIEMLLGIKIQMNDGVKQFIQQMESYKNKLLGMGIDVNHEYQFFEALATSTSMVAKSTVPIITKNILEKIIEKGFGQIGANIIKLAVGDFATDQSVLNIITYIGAEITKILAPDKYDSTIDIFMLDIELIQEYRQLITDMNNAYNGYIQSQREAERRNNSFSDNQINLLKELACEYMSASNAIIFLRILLSDLPNSHWSAETEVNYSKTYFHAILMEDRKQTHRHPEFQDHITNYNNSGYNIFLRPSNILTFILTATSDSKRRTYFFSISDYAINENVLTVRGQNLVFQAPFNQIFDEFKSIYNNEKRGTIIWRM